MKVLVITGSPHKNGTSACLADRFIEGAKEAGHEVVRFDAAFKDVHPCIACERCHNTDKGCAFKDDMEALNPKLAAADVIAFVSPIYYYTFSAQIKAVIDRFYANEAILHKNKKAVILLTMAVDAEETADGTMRTFKSIADWLEWEIVGSVLGIGCNTMEDMKKNSYPEQAYELGRTL